MAYKKTPMDWMKNNFLYSINLSIAVCLLIFAGCGSDNNDASVDSDFRDTDSKSGRDSEQDSSAEPNSGCALLPLPSGSVVTVSSVDELVDAVNTASEGTAILIEDGEYLFNGEYLWIDKPGMSIRSAGGDRSAVVIDGNYSSSEIITVAASDVTIADLTIARAYTHPIHVVSTAASHTLRTLIYNVHIIDPREQAIKINPSAERTHFTDYGTIACSRIEMTDEGRAQVSNCYTGGVDAHQSEGWIIRDNHIEGFFCDRGLSEHAVHMWRGCKDTIVERNVLVNNARGVGFGLADSGEARTYDNSGCSAGGYVDHYGGIIRNNVIFASRDSLFTSEYGFDCGVCLWSACGAKVLHNTIVSTGDNFSSIEWRFSSSVDIDIINNIATHSLRERDNASAVQVGNLTDASLTLFVNASEGDFHLQAGAEDAIDRGEPLADGLCDEDMDGEPRDSAPDIGADEV